MTMIQAFPSGGSGSGLPSGGTTGQVLAKKTNADQDVEWKDDAGGHTIKNDSGTSMTQRANLQFKGLDVTDDSTNNLTKVAGIGLNSDSIDDIASGEVPTNIVQTGQTYSTTEQVVGKWINGKPIYQLTVYANKSSLVSGRNDLVYTLDHPATVWAVWPSYLHESTYNESWPLGSFNVQGNPTWSDSGVGYQFWIIFIGYTKIGFTISQDLYNRLTSSVIDGVFFTIQYTKTTD